MDMYEFRQLATDGMGFRTENAYQRTFGVGAWRFGNGLCRFLDGTGCPDCAVPILYEDLRRPGGTIKASREFRYEAFCPKCGDCDASGYSTVAELRAESPGWWRGGDL